MFRSVLTVLSLFLISGCAQEYSQKADVFETVPASGVLTYKGQPLAGFRVMLKPDGDQRTASATTDAEGKFVLGTNSLDDGAVVGTHKVSVVWETSDDGMGDVIDDPSKLPKPPVALPADYANPDKSNITVQIPEGGTSELKIELK